MQSHDLVNLFPIPQKQTYSVKSLFIKICYAVIVRKYQEKEDKILTGYTHYLVLGSAGISQLLSLGEGCIGFRNSAQYFKSNAFVVPGIGIVWIQSDSLIISLD